MLFILLSKLGRNKTKRLFIDQFCLSLLNTFISPEDFEKMNIEKRNIHLIDVKQKSFYKLDELKEQMVLYIIQPNKEVFSIILESYFLISSMFIGVEANIIFIPGESYEIIEYMMANDLLEKFKIYSFNVDLLPIDNDLLSLEKENCFKEIYIDKNLTSISEMANAFVKLESCFGKVKHRYLKGDNAKIFENLVREKEKENNIKTNEEILGMIVLDRSVDFLTTLTTNYTYEGLIDDFFNINFGTIKIKESFIRDITNNKNTNTEKTITYSLTSFQNDFYSRIGCMHYVDANKYLTRTTQYYQKFVSKDKEKSTIEDIEKESNELKVYIKEIKDPLKTNKNLMYHIITNVSDTQYLQYIKNEQLLLTGELPANLHLYYDDYICEKRDLHKILKLMVIESLTQGGIQDYNSIKRDILNIYGYQNIFLFRDLEHLGWLKEKTYIKNLIDMSYEQICQKLDLISRDSTEKKVEDCSFTMGGFCPISLRLIEKAVVGKWNKIQEIIRKMPGEVSFPLDESEIAKPPKEVNTIFLVFIGGVTYTEIEGVRFLNRKFKEAYDKSTSKKPIRIQIIIVTTGILNSKKIFLNLGKEFKNLYSMKQFYDQKHSSKK